MTAAKKEHPAALENVPRIVAGYFYKVGWYLGVDPDELLQEARIAAWRAEAAYDPTKGAKMASFATTCCINHLLGVLDSRKRSNARNIQGKHAEWGEVCAVPDARPDPEHASMFIEMLRQLPDDARTVTQLILGNAGRFGGAGPHKAKKMLASRLCWSADRLKNAYALIEAALRARLGEETT